MKHPGASRVEMLVAGGLILLLGILMLLAVLDAQRRSRDIERVAAVREAQADIETYRARNASYPATADGLPAAEAAVVAALGYQAEPTGCQAGAAELCRDYVLHFTLEGSVGVLAGGVCEAHPGQAITCTR